MKIDRAWIQAHIPHQGTMCLLEEVSEWSDSDICCRASSHRALDNPLRNAQGLPASAGIEYAAQAMALHGALLAGDDQTPQVGYLTHVRNVTWTHPRLDQLLPDLTVQAQRVSGNELSLLYDFRILAGTELLLSGRAGVLIKAPAPATLPLLPGASASQTIAYRQQQAVSQAEFLQHVLQLAAQLPNTGHVFNLCKDRYWFAVALFAAIRRGIVSLLQNSTAPDNMAALLADYPDAVCLGEADTPMLAQMPYLQVTQAAERATPLPLPLEMPQIPRQQCIARIFTSGSTGKPQAHSMRFGRMQQCALAEAERMWQVAGARCSVLGTVSPQHMFGLEASVLLPIFGAGQFSSRQPFFPADVASALAELPEPRLLVSTPFHLRKLMEARIAWPRVSAVLSATAPLAPELAREVEAQLAAPLVEIYGSTETGALATRRPSVQDDWHTYAGITLQQQGTHTLACASHFDTPQALNDVLELQGPTRFRLLGRNADMINMVGKRSSLAYLNQLLLSLPGVQDGLFCMHEGAAPEETPRLAAFVVAPKLRSADILARLRLHIDPVFLPRPLIMLETLPRDANGKMPATSLASLRARHLAPRR